MGRVNKPISPLCVMDDYKELRPVSWIYRGARYRVAAEGHQMWCETGEWWAQEQPVEVSV